MPRLRNGYLSTPASTLRCCASLLVIIRTVHIGFCLTANLGGASGIDICVLITLGGDATLDAIAFAKFPKMHASFFNAATFSSQLLNGDAGDGCYNAEIRSRAACVA